MKIVRRTDPLTTMSLLASIFGSTAAADAASSANKDVPSGSLSALFDSSITPAPKRNILLSKEEPKKRERETIISQVNEQPLQVQGSDTNHGNQDQTDDDAVLMSRKKTRKERSLRVHQDPEQSHALRASKRNKEANEQQSKSTRDKPSNADQNVKFLTKEKPTRKKERKVGKKEDVVESTETVEKVVGTKVMEDHSGDPTDSTDREDRTVFVGNLPISATSRKTLERVFRSCGKIESTRLRSLPVAGVKLPPERAGDQQLSKKVAANTHALDTSKKNTIHGYVVFEEAASVAKALLLNNTLLPDTQIRIRVDSASPTLDPSRSVFVGNLPYHADETSLQKHFVEGCDFTSPEDVEGVRIVRDPTTFACKGFGYVLFKTKAMSATALSKMHESVYMKRTLRVMVCGKRFKGRRGQAKTANEEMPAKSTPNKPKSRQPPPSQDKEKAAVSTSASTPIAALRRILRKEQQHKDTNSKTNKRKRGTTPGTSSSGKKNVTAKKSGVSKRAVAEAKTGKRVKKIQKRINKGMGKGKA